jgi:membrane protein required for colicin V production
MTPVLPEAQPWIIDGIALLIIFLSAFSGLAKGAIKVLGTIAGFAGAILAAWHFAPMLARVFAPKIPSSFFATALAFLIIFLCAMLVVALLVYILTRLFEAILLGWLNKLLGFIAGLIIGVFVVIFIVWVLLEIWPGLMGPFLATRLVRPLVMLLSLISTGKPPFPASESPV